MDVPLPHEVLDAIGRLPKVHATDADRTGGWPNDRESEGEGGAWTISDNPALSGWETDSGHYSYGLTEQRAKDIAAILNWARVVVPYLERTTPGRGSGETEG
jgi:hypothetical protein